MRQRYGTQGEVDRTRKALAEFRKLESKPILTPKEQQKYRRLRHRLGGSTW
ncbi:MAG: hypothetical protein VB133_09400 [Anaeromusa sp.]|uniref:hypothetical protein n=1 Tax=Anaeromusa sp. TaxID=1872520 RepID=UPI002B20A059|nr:hypothetical protein [Anaeromusa sp.]MEA4835338.1 hypothetical protein [Anaeromusa sp.]